MKIYKIIKPGDTRTVYVGRTDQSLKRRLQKHTSDSKLYSHRPVYQWFDSTCEIYLIENYIGNNYAIREMEVVQEYISNGYVVMNEFVGNKLLNKNEYVKNNNIKLNSKKNSDYNNWCSSICRKAKKEGLNSKEYREKYNLEYLGLKTK